MVGINDIMGSVTGSFGLGQVNWLSAAAYLIFTMAFGAACWFILKPQYYRFFYPLEFRILEYTGGGFRWGTDYGQDITNKAGVTTTHLGLSKRNIEPMPKNVMVRQGKKKYIVTVLRDVQGKLHPMEIKLEKDGDFKALFVPRRRDVEPMAYEEMKRRFVQHNVLSTFDKAMPTMVIGGIILAGIIVMYMIKTTS